MDIKWYDKEGPKITDIKVRLEEGKVILTFKWPNELEQIYIYKQSMLCEETIDWEKPYRKYTKNEYASFNGFIDKREGEAMCRYVLCPYIQNQEEAYIVQFEDKCNEVEIITQKIEVRYQINEKKKLFSSRKTIQMSVFCETKLPRDYLCYVKKKGTIPTGIKDGTCFQFISDFEPGDNVFSEIEVDKDEYVRIYLSDDVPFKEAYRVLKI